MILQTDGLARHANTLVILVFVRVKVRVRVGVRARARGKVRAMVRIRVRVEPSRGEACHPCHPPFEIIRNVPKAKTAYGVERCEYRHQCRVLRVHAEVTKGLGLGSGVGAG